MVNRQRLRHRGGGAGLAGGAHRLEGALDDAEQRAESDGGGEKRRDGDLVGGAERRRRAAALAQRVDRQPKRGNARQIRLLGGERAERGQIRRRHARGDPLAIGQAMRDRRSHVRRGEAGDQRSVGEGGEAAPAEGICAAWRTPMRHAQTIATVSPLMAVPGVDSVSRP